MPLWVHLDTDNLYGSFFFYIMQFLVARQSYFILLEYGDNAAIAHVIVTISYFLLCSTKSRW